MKTPPSNEVFCCKAFGASGSPAKQFWGADLALITAGVLYERKRLIYFVNHTILSRSQIARYKLYLRAGVGFQYNFSLSHGMLALHSKM
jgi:hypothetical protein